jgi:hypothetical protein
VVMMFTGTRQATDDVSIFSSTKPAAHAPLAASSSHERGLASSAMARSQRLADATLDAAQRGRDNLLRDDGTLGYSNGGSDRRVGPGAGAGAHAARAWEQVPGDFEESSLGPGGRAGRAQEGAGEAQPAARDQGRGLLPTNGRAGAVLGDSGRARALQAHLLKSALCVDIL